MPNPTLADMLNPTVRAWVYAIAGIVVPLLAILALIWPVLEIAALITSAVVTFAGFQLARSNTPAGTPPPKVDALDAPDAGLSLIETIVLVVLIVLACFGVIYILG